MQFRVMRFRVMQCGRRLTAVAAAVTLAGGLFSVARADLPQSVRESGSAEQFKDDINKYVSEQIDRVKAADKSSAEAREQLARQAESTQTVSPSSSFQTMYVSAVVSNLGPMLTAKEVPLRLNAGIIVYRLCSATRAPQLAPVAQQLMKDPAPAAALWGVKSGAVLLPTIISVPFNLKSQKLTMSIVDAVKLHGNIGPIVQEAYNAVSIADQNPPLSPAALQACIDAVNGIELERIKAWQAGVPAAAQADRTPTIFFARGTINRAMTKEQRATTVQCQLSFLTLAAQKAVSATAGDRKVLFDIASSNAAVLKVILLNDNQAAVAAKFNDLIRLPSNLQPDQIASKISDATAAVKAIPDYSGIKAASASGSAK